jgi:hypothetical protein
MAVIGNREDLSPGVTSSRVGYPRPGGGRGHVRDEVLAQDLRVGWRADHEISNHQTGALTPRGPTRPLVSLAGKLGSWDDVKVMMKWVRFCVHRFDI